ncbi:MAG: mannonate dehydratase [Planctomycetota bacterium]
MKPTLLLPPAPDDSWKLAVQAGVRYAVTKPTAALSGLGEPDRPGVLTRLRARFADAGLELLGLEGDPFDVSAIKLGGPMRDQAIERYIALLGEMHAAGLGLLCFNFMVRPPRQSHDWSRTRLDHPTRGDAEATAFRLADLPEAGRHDEVDPHADAVWANFHAFVSEVLPFAVQAGVAMALHPDDPPVPRLAGVDRIFGTREAFEQATSRHPNLRVTFCQANFLLMPGDLVDHARALADRIAFVHWRDVAGHAEHFSETFHDDGPTDMLGMLRLYAELGFNGPIRMDHAPLMHGEPTPWMPGYGVQGRLMAIAYLRGLLQGAGIVET